MQLDNISQRNPVLRAYRFIKRRQLALAYSKQGEYELDAAEVIGGQINICPVLRLVFLWSWFVLPSWTIRFVVYPVVAFIFCASLLWVFVGSIGNGVVDQVYPWLGLTPTEYARNDEWLGHSVGFVGVGALTIVVFILYIIVTVWIVRKVFSAHERTKVRPVRLPEERILPVIKTWWEGFWAKVCPLATVVK
jgi:hypothetical protein